MKEKENTEVELDTLRKTTVEKMWITELNTLEKEYAKYKTKREKIQTEGPSKKSSQATKKKVVVKKKK